jgi:hypothetical protein
MKRVQEIFTVIQNKPLDFVAHGFFARLAEMDFDAVGGVIVHRLSFP